MTVCIAAVTRNPTSIIAVCDALISNSAQDFSGELTMLKWRMIAADWRALVSADDLASFEPVIQRVSSRLDPFGGKFSVDAVRNAMVDGYNEELQFKIEKEILGRYKISLDDFLKDGYKKFGRDVFGNFVDNIAQASLGLDFLVYGYDDGGVPHLFILQSPQYKTENVKIDSTPEALGFGVIGAGSTVADGALMQAQIQRLSFDAQLLAVCDAKFRAAEATRSVGRETYAFVLEPDGKEVVLNPPRLAEIRDKWLARQPKPDEQIMGDLSNYYKAQKPAALDMRAKIKEKIKEKLIDQEPATLAEAFKVAFEKPKTNK